MLPRHRLSPLLAVFFLLFPLIHLFQIHVESIAKSKSCSQKGQTRGQRRDEGDGRSLRARFVRLCAGGGAATAVGRRRPRTHLDADNLFDFRELKFLISVKPTESRIDQSQNIKMICCFAKIRMALLFTHSDSNPSSNIVFVSAIGTAAWQVKFDHQLAVLPAETHHTVAAIIAAIEKEMKREWKKTQVRADGTICRVGRRECHKSAAT
jgi:hypothetical protein